MEIVEVAPRDGLQNEAAVVDTDTKLALIDQAIGASVRGPEATMRLRAGVCPPVAAEGTR